jgi:ribosomal protein S18 acetylase RimI-like enzyme
MIMKFSKARVEDINALHEFELRCFDRPEDQFPKRNLRHLITSPTSITLLVKDEADKIIGEVIGLLRNFSIPSGRVYKIAVDPQIQKKGMGSEILHEIERLFRKRGMKKSCAEVRVGNKASRRMFEKNAYHLTRTIDGYYANGEAAVKLWKEL